MSDRGAPHFAGLLALILVVWIAFYWLTPRPGSSPPEPDVSINRGGEPDDASSDESIDDQSEDAIPTPVDDDPTDAADNPDQADDGHRLTVEPPTYRIHVVAPGGETLQDIAKRYYGSYARWRAIARANGHSVDPNRLLPGTEVKVPLDPDNVQGLPLDDDGGAIDPDPEPEVAYTEYIVSRNDSLWTIAKALYGSGAKWRVIRDANRDLVGEEGEKLRPGMVLRIPPPPGN